MKFCQLKSFAKKQKQKNVSAKTVWKKSFVNARFHFKTKVQNSPSRILAQHVLGNLIHLFMNNTIYILCRVLACISTFKLC